MKIFIAVISILFFVFAAHAQKQAEVIVTSTFLRRAPDAASEKVRTLQKGEQIVLEKSADTNGWFYVSAAADRTIKGWIRKDTIRRIADAEKPKPATAPPIAAKPLPAVVSTPASVPSPASSPTPKSAEDEEVLRVETEEVRLNVRVTDGGNRTVKNLDQAQFKVYEDDVLQPITSVTTAEVPVVNALLIDNSRSLRAQLEKIIEAGKIIVGSNLAQDESAVARFVGKDKIQVVQDFTTDKNSLNNALDNLFVEGGQTAITDAIYQTAKKVDEYQKSQKKEDVKIRALILISDGDDRASSRQEAELFDLLRQSQVQIFAVGFIADLSRTPEANGISRRQKAEDFLTRLARETGGKVYFPAAIAELPSVAADISGEIRTQYVISYTPINEKRDETFRKIKVLVAEADNGEKRIVTARTGRTVTAKQP